jgi:hypothetical protein
MNITKEYVKKIILEEMEKSMSDEALSQWNRLTKRYKNLAHKPGLQERFAQEYARAKESSLYSGTTPSGEHVMLSALDSLEM